MYKVSSLQLHTGVLQNIYFVALCNGIHTNFQVCMAQLSFGPLYIKMNPGLERDLKALHEETKILLSNAS